MGNQQGKERKNHKRKIDWENAEKPSPPGKPYLVPEVSEQESDFITIRWAPPVSDGGAPILGYVVEHRRTGSPHWLRAIPYLAVQTKLTLTGLEPGWRYQFRVSAENDMGRSLPGEVSEVLTVTSQRTAATAPHFNVELQDMIALENEKVEFIVHVVAIPQAKISWYKDGFEVFSSRRMKILTENDQSTFIIHQAVLEDEGEIKCTATNRAGHSVTKAILKLEAPPRIRLPRQYEDGLLFEKGELIRLKVSTAGRPSPHITWYHNGEVLESNEKYEIKDAERSSILKINEAQREDRGEYMVKGTNKIGEDVVSFLVTVTDRPLPPGKPKVVMTLGRSVSLCWTNPEDDGGCKIGSYIVEYFRIGWNMWLKAATCRQLTTTLSELIEGSEYKFRIKAENPYGMSEPSEESDVIFIPDPKRGILSPPSINNELKVDVWLEESLKDFENDKKEKNSDNELEKRKTLHENARKLLDTPLQVLIPQENANHLRNASSFSSIALKENVSDRKNRSHENVGSNNVAPPVPKRRQKQKYTQSPSQLMEVEHEEIPEEVDGKSNDEEEMIHSKRNLTDVNNHNGHSHFLREEDRTMFHGSSELMLVLLPEEQSKSIELSAKQRSELEMTLIGTGVAPPMSLSAPELGSGEPIELPLMRDAVSSTELLHERTMARFYQDAMNEESQKFLKRRFSSDRKSVERRSSLRESSLPERQHSFRENIHLEKKEMNNLSRYKSKAEKDSEETTFDERSIAPVNMRGEVMQEGKPLLRSNDFGGEKMSTMLAAMKKTSEAKEELEKERLSSVEREEMEFALVRERIRVKNEQNLKGQVTSVRPMKMRHNISSASSKRSSYGDDDDEIIEDEDAEEEEEEEEVEEDYLEEEEEKDESMDEIVDTLQDSQYCPKSLLENISPPVPKDGLRKGAKMLAPKAEEEDVSSHPVTSRITLPRLKITLTPPVESPAENVADEVTPTPSTERQSSHVQEQEQNEEEEKQVEISSEIPIKKEKRRAVKILKKLGLRKEKKIPEIIVESSASGSPLPLPKPILINKLSGRKRDKNSNGRDASGAKWKLSREDASDDGSAKKKKQVRITEPSEDSASVSGEGKEKAQPLTEDEQAARVLICHYSDIVREFGQGRKSVPRQYLNCDELKALVPDDETANGSGETGELDYPAETREPSELAAAEEVQANGESIAEEEITIRSLRETNETSVAATSSLPVTSTKTRATAEYLTDVAMFAIACWLYLFNNELYAIPVLCLMAYRQISDAVGEKYSSLRESLSKRFRKKKIDENG